MFIIKYLELCAKRVPTVSINADKYTSLVATFNICLAVEMDGSFLERWLAFRKNHMPQPEMQSEAWELRLGWSSLWVQRMGHTSRVIWLELTPSITETSEQGFCINRSKVDEITLL